MKNKVLSVLRSWTFIFGIQVVLSLILTYLLIHIGFLLFRYEFLIIIILFVLTLITFLLMLPSRQASFRTTRRQLLGKILSIVLSIVIAIASIGVFIGDHALNRIGYTDTQTMTFSVVVLKESSYKKIQDLNNKIIGINPRLDDSDYFNVAVDRLTKKIEYDTEPYANDEKIVDGLFNKKVDAIFINESHRPLINEYKSNFNKDTRVIWSTKVTLSLNDNDGNIDVTKDAFNMYISGIDTAGNISNVSRSDVNMIVTVNPISREILLTSIPRDYYVTLANVKKKDKLTHSGLSGVDNTCNTVSNLLGVKMNFFSRVNFTSLVKVVDALGGIDVNSDRDLSAWTGKNIKKGMNHMDGETALAYARCRHAYQNGDVHRVQNQQDVLMAIINKLMSPALLKNYRNVLGAVEDSYQTSLKKDQIADLVKMQMSSGKAWKFKSYVMTGTGKIMKGGYYMPNTALYYMIPNEDSVKQAKQNIKNTMNGVSY